MTMLIHAFEGVTPMATGKKRESGGSTESDLPMTRIPLHRGAGHMPALGFGTQDPRDQNGNVVYDHGVTLLDTWGALESLVDHGKCRAIGLSDVSLNELKSVYDAARIKPAVVQVEAHPYLPETELLAFCKERDIALLAFAPLGHGMRPGPLEDPVILAIAARARKAPAQVLLAWAVQRGTALLTTPRTAARRERISISLPFPQTPSTRSIAFRPDRG
jgi:hypothetical protein